MKKVRGFEVVVDYKRKTDGDVILPQRGTSKAMAYDFYSNAKYTAKPGETIKVFTDVKAYMQEDECLVLNIRSSMGGKWLLVNMQGWVDADYYSNESNDGNIGFFLKNVSNETLVIDVHDRIGQGAFFKYLVADNGNAETKRKGGFGSTGK